MTYIYKQKIGGKNENGEFGFSVAIDNYYTVVGVPGNNNLSIYKRDINNEWSFIKTITAASGNFGYSVDIHNIYIIVGNPEVTGYTGNINIYKKDEGGDDNWGIVQTLTGAAVLYEFGTAVSIYSNYCIIGASRKDTWRGAAYIAKKGIGGWPLLTVAGNNGELLPETTQSEYDYFGCSVSIDGDYAVVGASGEDTNKGTVYIFYKNEGGTDRWGLQQRIIASDGEENDRFGCSVSLSGDYLVVGAKDKDSSNNEQSAGSAYIFKRSGDSWYEIDKLNASTESAGLSFANFGNSVDIKGDYIIVGAPGVRNNMGMADIFYKYRNWSHLKKIIPPDGISGDGSKFGCSVGISESFAVVGSYLNDIDPSIGTTGSVYFFDKSSIVLRLAQEFEVDGQYLPSKASVYLKRIGKNINNYWMLYNDQRNVIDATNFSSIIQKDNKIIFDDRITDFTGNGYMILAPEDNLDIIGYTDLNFGTINFPIKANSPAKFSFLLRSLIYTSNPSLLPTIGLNPSAPQNFIADILLDGLVIAEINERINYNEWQWLNTNITIPDQEEHILGIRLKEKNCAIDKIYLDTEAEYVTAVCGQGPSYSISPYITIHLKVYEPYRSYPSNPLFIYDYKNTIEEVKHDDWYNFNIKILDKRLGNINPSAFGGNYFLVLSTSGENNQNFIIWEMLENDEYNLLASAIKI